MSYDIFSNLMRPLGTKIKTNTNYQQRSAAQFKHKTDLFWSTFQCYKYISKFKYGYGIISFIAEPNLKPLCILSFSVPILYLLQKAK